jgi:nicotinamidase/pyrazinamidase
LRFEKGDALVVVDVQRDFLPGGALGVPKGDEVVPVLDRYIAAAAAAGVPVFASRDAHPVNHCSFEAYGGPWPPHCVAGTEGAELAPELHLPAGAIEVNKGTREEPDAYSAFDGTDLDRELRDRGVRRLWIGGLATDYCVLQTVLDARKAGYDVLLLEDAIRSVEVRPGDGARAIERMREAGATPVRYSDLRLAPR